ncbi:MAG: hypothetical protein LLG01_17250 [Planctomycetaceae bacterium]|nr:hypothetical protein [Planctomycetaceae bacterium]
MFTAEQEIRRVAGKFVPPTAEKIAQERQRQMEILRQVRARILTVQLLRTTCAGTTRVAG